MQVTEMVGPKNRELLIHMLGAGDHINRRSRGYRNYFCAEVGGPDHQAMVVMENAGLVRRGYTINDGRDQIFHATLEGCQAAGLSRAATKKALAP